MARTRESQSLHDTMVLTQAEYWVGQGSGSVYADLAGWAKPPQIGGYIPDVYVKGKTLLSLPIITEVETGDTVGIEHTRLQWRAFDRALALFHVVVPKSALRLAQQNAQTWGITVDKWWYRDGE